MPPRPPGSATSAPKSETRPTPRGLPRPLSPPKPVSGTRTGTRRNHCGRRTRRASTGVAVLGARRPPARVTWQGGAPRQVPPGMSGRGLRGVRAVHGAHVVDADEGPTTHTSPLTLRGCLSTLGSPRKPHGSWRPDTRESLQAGSRPSSACGNLPSLASPTPPEKIKTPRPNRETPSLRPPSGPPTSQDPDTGLLDLPFPGPRHRSFGSPPFLSSGVPSALVGTPPSVLGDRSNTNVFDGTPPTLAGPLHPTSATPDATRPAGPRPE